MPEGQSSLYYVTAESRSVAERSPHLEAFRARGYEVLYFVDPVDEFLAQSVHEFEGKPLVSVARAGVEPGSEAERKQAEEARRSRESELRPFLAFLERTLADTIREARVSSRLTTSPACLVAGEHDLSPGLERLLRHASGKDEEAAARRILEINDAHEVVGKLRALHAASPDDPSAGRRRAPAARCGAPGRGHGATRTGRLCRQADLAAQPGTVAAAAWTARARMGTCVLRGALAVVLPGLAFRSASRPASCTSGSRCGRGRDARRPWRRHALLISDNPSTSEPRRVLTAMDGTVDSGCGRAPIPSSRIVRLPSSARPTNGRRSWR